MARSISILFALGLSAVILHADLVLEQQASDGNRTRTAILKLHGNQMRLDQSDDAMSIIVNLQTRDSFTLLTTNKTYLFKFGSEVRWEMEQEKKYTGGTNEMDRPPAPAVPTGKSEWLNGYDTELYTWTGAHGLTETLWVARSFTNYEAIRIELAKVDQFNDSGPHRNAQPALSRLPGMVIKGIIVTKMRTVTNTLVSVKLEPLDASLFELPTDYSQWQREKKNP